MARAGQDLAPQPRITRLAADKSGSCPAGEETVAAGHEKGVWCGRGADE